MAEVDEFAPVAAAAAALAASASPSAASTPTPTPEPTPPLTPAGMVWSLLRRIPIAVWFGIALVGWYVINLYRNQNALLYHPVVPGLPFRAPHANPPPYDSPATWGMAFDDVYITTADSVKLHGWFVRPAHGIDSATAPTVVFFHGNAGNVGFRLPNIDMFANQLRVNVLIFDYRGYGNSDDAVIDEEGLKRDGEAVAAYIASRTDIDRRKVLLFGRSLGGAVAVRVAVDRPGLVRRLVLVDSGGIPAGRSELADALTALRMTVGAGAGFWPLMARDSLRTGLRALRTAGKGVRTDDATAFLPRIAAPTLVLRGERDALVTLSLIHI